MNKFIVDSSVILALVNEETYTLDNLDELVRKGAIICGINYVEVLSKLIDNGLTDIDQLEHLLKSVYCKHIYNVDDEVNSIAVQLSIYRKTYNLSLGDRYCLALGKKLELPIYTADKVWKKLEELLGINIVLIR